MFWAREVAKWIVVLIVVGISSGAGVLAQHAGELAWDYPRAAFGLACYAVAAFSVLNFCFRQMGKL